MMEKRKFIRFKAPFCVQYSKEGSAQEFLGVIKDISMAGVRLTLDAACDILPASLASLSILLPEKSLAVPAKVIWARDIGELKEVGFSFAGPVDSTQEQIHQHILKPFNEEFGRDWWQM